MFRSVINKFEEYIKLNKKIRKKKGFIMRYLFLIFTATILTNCAHKKEKDNSENNQPPPKLLKPEVRKAGGVYYTPQYIVDYIVKNTVGKLIEGKTPKEISQIKIVDPACGSGSFLIGVYDCLLKYHNNYYNQNPKQAESDNCLKQANNIFSFTLMSPKVSVSALVSPCIIN